jgi:RNA polymerase sigma factor (sigma-70 family)
LLANAPYNEAQLLARLSAGDEQAFTEIYHHYWQQLFFIAFKRLASSEDAREIVQNVFMNLWEKRQTLQIDSLPLYLAAMTRYSVYRYLANAGRRKRLAQHLSVATSAYDEIVHLENKQFLEILTELTNTLPEKYRLVFIHHKLLDRPLDEVANRLGVSLRTAEAYVAKVMNFMRTHCKPTAYFMGLSILL